MSVSTYTKSGSKSSTPVKLDKNIFGLAVDSHELIKKAHDAYLANGRVNLARTKKRGEVRGGGRKPIRQKGTGYARVGSTRNPLWTGGGVAFGPTGDENYKLKISKKHKKQALCQALSVAAKENRISVIDSLSFSKTKEVVALLDKLNLTGRVLIAVDSKTADLARSVRNLKNVKLVQAAYLNVYDLLNADRVLFTKDGLNNLKLSVEGKK